MKKILIAFMLGMMFGATEVICGIEAGSWQYWLMLAVGAISTFGYNEMDKYYREKE
jgi:hypothetical protein